MRTLSIGSSAVGAAGERQLKSTVMQPARPKNMSTHSTICDPTVREGVMPSVSPTVPIAENTSNTISVR